MDLFSSISHQFVFFISFYLTPPHKTSNCALFVVVVFARVQENSDATRREILHNPRYREIRDQKYKKTRSDVEKERELAQQKQEE